MDKKTQETIMCCLIRGWFAFVFVATLLYVIYAPMANLLGTNYETAWTFGAGFGFAFTPVVAWVAKVVLMRIQSSKNAWVL